jgi:hypothetical protein
MLYGEMWDTTDLNPRCELAAAESPMSLKGTAFTVCVRTGGSPRIYAGEGALQRSGKHSRLDRALALVKHSPTGAALEAAENPMFLKGTAFRPSITADTPAAALAAEGTTLAPSSARTPNFFPETLYKPYNAVRVPGANVFSLQFRTTPPRRYVLPDAVVSPLCPRRSTAVPAAQPWSPRTLEHS